MPAPAAAPSGPGSGCERRSRRRAKSIGLQCGAGRRDAAYRGHQEGAGKQRVTSRQQRVVPGRQPVARGEIHLLAHADAG